MKAITLTQPWATLVAIGAKTIETRSWGTAYRGPLAIHAAKNFPPDARRMLATQEPFRSAFLKAGYHIGPLKNPNWIPLGCIVAVCYLSELYRIPRPREHFPPVGERYITLPPFDPEYSFGDYAPGRWAWILSNVKALSTPIPCRGALGLWECKELIAIQ